MKAMKSDLYLNYDPGEVMACRINLLSGAQFKCEVSLACTPAELLRDHLLNQLIRDEPDLDLGFATVVWDTVELPWARSFGAMLHQGPQDRDHFIRRSDDGVLDLYVVMSRVETAQVERGCHRCEYAGYGSEPTSESVMRTVKEAAFTAQPGAVLLTAGGEWWASCRGCRVVAPYCSCCSTRPPGWTRLKWCRCPKCE